MVMSALPSKADMCGALADVCFGPIADMLKRKIEDPLAGVSTQFLAFWCGPLFCLEWKLNNPIHRCDPQTKGISFAGASLVEKARSNLFLARS